MKINFLFLIILFLAPLHLVLADSDTLTVTLRTYASDYSANITLIANQTTTVDARTETNTTLELITNINVSGSIYIGFSPENIGGTSGVESLTAISQFISVEPSTSITNALTSTMIYVYYNDSDLGAVTESSLRLYYWDGTTWGLTVSGVNTTVNYVWANVSQFGRFGVFGTVPSSTTTGGGGSGGEEKCFYSWDCTDWGPCRPDNTQTRMCVNTGVCADSYRPPETNRGCFYLAWGEDDSEIAQIVEGIVPGEEPSAPEPAESQITGFLTQAFEQPEEGIEFYSNITFNILAILILFMVTMLMLYFIKKRSRRKPKRRHGMRFHKPK